MDKSPHISVMPNEVLEFLAPSAGGRYLDGTLGFGGHTSLILQSRDDVRVLGLDRDEKALASACERLAPFGERFVGMHSPFSRFEHALEEMGWDTIDGALVDLGVSSMQLDQPERGFSFLREGPLDMRMDPSSGAQPASLLVNTADFQRLARIIGNLGEEPQAGRIARAIIKAREEKPFETTLELASVVERAYPAKWRRTARNHPATKTFQALRMAINSELEELEIFLERIVDALRPGGRIVCISFHSLEDRIVKHTFRREAKGCDCPPRQPFCTCGKQPTLKILTKKPLLPTEEECAQNTRSRSAKLRAAEKLELEDGRSD